MIKSFKLTKNTIIITITIPHTILKCSTWNILRVTIQMFHVEHFAYSRNKHYKPNNKGYNGRFRKAEGKCQQLYKNKHSVEPNTHKMFHVEHFSICRWAVVPRGTFC